MKNWQNFYLQRMGVDGNDNAYPVCESVSTWGVWCKEIPFKIADKVKEPAKRTWYDEHGDDEYIPNSGLFMEAYTIKIEFGCKIVTGDKVETYGTSVDDVRANVGEFLTYLRTAGMMKMYSTYTRIGRKEVRLSSIGDKAWKSKEDGQEYLVFEVEFKVNDPVTDIILDNGELTEDE